MAGLLDFMGSSFDDPKTAATLQLAQGLLTSPRLMQGAAQGLLGYNQTMTQAKRAKMLEEAQMLQLEQAKAEAAQRARQEAFRQSLPSPQFQIGQEALAANGGFKGATAPLPKADPNQELLFGAMRAGLVDPVQYINATRKDTAPLKLGAGEGLYDPKTFKPLVVNPKEDSAPGDWKLYQLSGAAARGIPFDQWDMQRRRASATTVSVNTDGLGLKPKDRFEMEGKLADDFKSTTKLDSAVLGSTRKIATALSQPGAIKDQAAIYSFAKMLDPDGAVREADYAAIANTAGALDRVRNYANRLLTGEQLTPAQRDEMLAMARAFEDVSRKRIDQAKKSFGQQAQRYNLRPEAVYGATDGAESPATGVDALLKKYGGN